jgi:hypothetical protein
MSMRMAVYIFTCLQEGMIYATFFGFAFTPFTNINKNDRLCSSLYTLLPFVRYGQDSIIHVQSISCKAGDGCKHMERSGRADLTFPIHNFDLPHLL